MFDSDKFKIFPNGSSSKPVRSSANISYYRVSQKKVYIFLGGFRVNIGIHKAAGYTYFCSSNEKFDYVLPILSKISLSEKDFYGVKIKFGLSFTQLHLTS